jgi:uncharacterized protein
VSTASVRQLDDVTILEELSLIECHRLLATQSIGRVGFVYSGRTFVLPVQYAYCAGDVLVRTADGSPFDRAIRGSDVVFEIDAVDPGYHAGWSVMARGVAERIDEATAASLLAGMPLRPWGLAERPGWVCIRITEATGRRILHVPQQFVGLVAGPS